MSNVLTSAWQGTVSALKPRVYESGTQRDTLCAEFRECYDLGTVDEQVQHRVAEGTPITWYDAYTQMFVVPWGRPSAKHPEYQGLFEWDIGSPIPMESGNAGINERETPTFRVPNRLVEWEYRLTDMIGIPSAPLGYSLMSGHTPGGPKVAIMANFAFQPTDQRDQIIFRRYTAFLSLDRDCQDWLNDYNQLVHQTTSTLADIDQDREKAINATIPQREGTKSTVLAAAINW